MWEEEVRIYDTPEVPNNFPFWYHKNDQKYIKHGIVQQFIVLNLMFYIWLIE